MPYIGNDPKTGYPMIVDNLGDVRLRLPECPCCGGEELLSHIRKFKGRHVCKECGAQWASYLVSKSRLNERSSIKSVTAHVKKVQAWIAIRNQNLLAPDGLDQELNSLCRYLECHKAEVEKLKPKATELSCRHCGAVFTDAPGKAAPKCPDCIRRYKRYRFFQTHLGTLDIEQCEDFNAVLDEYADMLRAGKWAPDIPKYRAKIRRRMDELM